MGVPYDDIFFHDVYRKWKPIGLSSRASDGSKIAIQIAAQGLPFLIDIQRKLLEVILSYRFQNICGTETSMT